MTRPRPAWGPPGTPGGPWLIRSSAVHLSSLVPSSFTPFGRSRTIVLTVLLLAALLTTVNLNLAALGFFDVPALDGVIETSSVTTGAGFCASAIAGMASAARLATAIGSFRKLGSSSMGQVAAARTPPRLEH